VSVAAGTCLQNRCPETALAYPPIPRSLHSNGSTRYNIFPMLANILASYEIISRTPWDSMDGEGWSCVQNRWSRVSIIFGSTVLLLDLGRIFNFLILYAVGWTPWTGDQPVLRTLPTHRTTQTQNKRIQTSMPRVELESTIPAFEDISRLRPRGHCDRQGKAIPVTSRWGSHIF
jgi:hypothetical protein